MKSFNLTFAVALVAAVSAVGCGSSQNNQPTPVSTVTGAVATQAIPTGCYNNPYAMTTGSQCAPCPAGYTLNGTSCIMTTNAGCTPSYNGAGYGCNTPTGYTGCGSYGSYSSSMYGCVTAQPGQYGTGYSCSPYGSMYVCSYPGTGQYAGYAYNGYGWVRVQ